MIVMMLYDVIKSQDDLHNQHYGTLSTFFARFVSLVSTTELLPLSMIFNILDLYYKTIHCFFFKFILQLFNKIFKMATKNQYVPNFNSSANISKKVQVGKDQEKAQSEKDSHSKNRGGKKPN